MDRIIVAAAALMLSTMPAANGAPPAHAAGGGARCGVGLVAGVAGCIEWRMKISEHKALVAKALKGDNEAADTLAMFHDEADDRTAEGGRKWRILAAERGHCGAIERMRSDADWAGRRAEASKWRTRARWNSCKPG
jgi:hypothetical protein